jgi:hypothetical protein
MSLKTGMNMDNIKKIYKILKSGWASLSKLYNIDDVKSEERRKTFWLLGLILVHDC